jgi:Ni,Fe-hydrogenase III large subunit
LLVDVCPVDCIHPTKNEAEASCHQTVTGNVARAGVPIIGGLTMSKNISKLPRGKKQIPIDVVRTRLRDHVELVLASNNEVLIRMIERFFSEMIDRLVRDGRIERRKGDVVPIRKKEKEDLK